MFKDEKIVETKTCKHCNSSFEITDKDLEFYEKVSPSFNGKKYLIPSPTLCPDCRQQRRLSFRNERKLYKRKCDATGENIISMYSPDKLYKVYNQDFWWSDKWDPLDYGKDFDFNKSFFEQIEDLFLLVPQPALVNNHKTQENSDYSNHSGYLKNCYLVYESGNCENVLYSESCRRTINSIDLSFATRCQYCYDCFYIFDSNKLFFSENCNNCSESYYLFNCINCNNCFGCNNLSNKSYCIENKQYSKEEYFKKINSINIKDVNISQYSKNRILKHINGHGNENVLGEYIYNSNYVYNSFHVKNLNNGKYCSYLSNSSNISSDCYDYDYFGGASKIYEALAVGVNSSNILFSFNTWDSSFNSLYCNMCHSIQNCFGCVGLKNKSYCILNKQYTKEEYETLVPKIIEHMQKTGEWGEFFPSSISPFGYNETVAMEYFPIGRDVAMQHLYKWSDYEPPFPRVDKIIPANKLPEDISQIPDDILNWAIECEVTKKPFRIISQELEFYRKHGLFIPKRHPDQRHLDRMALRNPRKLFDRKCDKCSKDIKTTYSPERSGIVYCEDCYLEII